MDPRTVSSTKTSDTDYVPTFKTFDLITPDNFQKRLIEVEALLNLQDQQLAALLDAESSIFHLENELGKVTTSNIDTLNNLIIEYTTGDVDNEEVAEYMSDKRSELTKKLQAAYNKIIAHKEEAITEYKKEVEKTRKIVLEKDINAGNYQLALNTFKFNIIAALQSAATRIHLTLNNINIKHFNHIFRGLSVINADETITHTAHPEHLMQGNLVALQQAIDGIFQECLTLGEANILNVIKQNLESLNHLNNPLIENQNVIKIYDSHIRFSDPAYQLERQCETARGLALSNYDELIRNEDQIINGFRSTTFKICDPVRSSIIKADENIEELKQASLHKNTDRMEEIKSRISSEEGMTDAAHTRPAFSPAPAPKPRANTDVQLKFWQTPSFKKGMIGAAIGLGLVATAALVATIIFFSGGAGAAAIGVGVGALVAKFGIGGVVGFSLAIASVASLLGFFAGTRVGSSHRKATVAPLKEASLSSTTGLMKEMPPSLSPASKKAATPTVTLVPAPRPAPIKKVDQEEEALRLSLK